MTGFANHVIILPIMLPIVAAAFMLLLNERRRSLKNRISISAALGIAASAIWLLVQVENPNTPEAFVYKLANWSAPFGIVLVADRLSALMVLVTATVGAVALLYSTSRWAVLGPRYHSLFLLLLMGLSGAFLTGDLFNLYVFFEVLLAASYGLLLHSSGRRRVKAGLHYVAVNLAGSFFFLVGVGVIYALTGTLNMADLVERLATLDPDQIPLLKAGAAVLGIAFLVKSGAWPLNFWLPTTYAAAAAPVAAIFSVMTKVGVYIILRLSSLLTGTEGSFELFGASWLLFGGVGTILFATFGVLSTRHVPRIAGYATIISSGTVLAIIGSGSEAVISAALYYLVGSTLGLAALFLLADQITRRERLEAADQDVGPIFHDDYETALQSEFEGVEVGADIPLTTALLASTFFLVTVLLVGLPPLSGFMAKFGILSGLLTAWVGQNGAPLAGTQTAAWLLVTLIVLSGFTLLLALVRSGIETFWTNHEQAATMALRPAEAAAVVLLVLMAIALSLFAGPALDYTDLASSYLADPDAYVRAVLGGVELVPNDVVQIQGELGGGAEAGVMP